MNEIISLIKLLDLNKQPKLLQTTDICGTVREKRLGSNMILCEHIEMCDNCCFDNVIASSRTANKLTDNL